MACWLMMILKGNTFQSKRVRCVTCCRRLRREVRNGATGVSNVPFGANSVRSSWFELKLLCALQVNPNPKASTQIAEGLGCNPKFAAQLRSENLS